MYFCVLILTLWCIHVCVGVQDFFPILYCYVKDDRKTVSFTSNQLCELEMKIGNHLRDCVVIL